MSWEIRNLMCDIEIVKEKLEDVATSLKTKEEVVNYGLAYNEHRIHNEQVTELMLSYLKELEGLMNKYKEIEKASSDVSLATESDNA
ncbi:MAG: DUF1474 family protein [Staphylococcus epidermidis]|nr:DUF1474 family protein [Staphylococcus epidermidis]